MPPLCFFAFSGVFFNNSKGENEMSVAAESVITKQLVFKQEVTGTARKTGKPFRMVELHDPRSLENTKFFLREGSSVNAHGLAFGDKVLASFSAEILYGKMEFVLDALQKA